MYKISVVVPVYNVEKYIERCALSLLEQTLSDIEIIFVDDCSTDNSIQVLNKMLVCFPDSLINVKIVRHIQNLGLAAARITGVRVAQGEYVAFCDSDDWVDKDIYNFLYTAIQTNDVDMVYSNYIVEFKKKHFISNLPEIESIEQYRMSLLYGTLPSFSCIRLYRKSILMNNLSVLYKPGIDMWEDARMNILLTPYLKSITYVSFAGYHYNQCNENAYTHLWSEKSRNNVMEVVDDVTNAIGVESKYVLPLCFFRLNAFHSILSHSTLLQMKNIKWKYMSDLSYIWKHPNMPFTNKLILFLFKCHFFYATVAFMKFKQIIRKTILR